MNPFARRKEAAHVGVAEARRLLDRAVPETDFQANVIKLATRTGWLVFHTYDSRRSTGAGFPDLVLCCPPRLLLIELKTEKGILTPEQVEWLDALGACTSVDMAVDVAVWRPSDWEDIEETLRAHHG